jgi:hypothetical protein
MPPKVVEPAPPAPTVTVYEPTDNVVVLVNMPPAPPPPPPRVPDVAALEPPPPPAITKYSTGTEVACNVPLLQPVDKYTFIKLVSVSKMVCPTKGEPGLVLEVHTVTTGTVEASLAEVIVLSAILAAVTALDASSVVPIEPAAATVPVISQIVPDHVQVRAPTV